MLHSNFCFRNPFSDRFDILCNKDAHIIGNKFFEFQFSRSSVIFEFGFCWRYRESHAGLSIDIGLLGYETRLAISDSRHWNYDEKRWYTIEEVAEQCRIAEDFETWDINAPSEIADEIYAKFNPKN